MSLPIYSTDEGSGIRVVPVPGEIGYRPKGFALEIHFYDRQKALEFAARLIYQMSQEACGSGRDDAKT